MPFTESERKDIAAQCTQFLAYRPGGTLSEKLHEIADSPYALVGNDNYGSGGFTTQLEREVAGMLGKEAAVFMPSGTMAQQIALRNWCDRAGNNTVAFHPTCHLEIHEQGAYRELHHLKAVLLGEKSRLFTLKDLEAVREKFAVLLVELPQREIGGQLPSWEELCEICRWAQERGIKTHLDGARLWECAPFYGRSYAEIAALFDSVYVSFYKILRGLPGAMLAGPADLIAESRIWLRRHGGNLVTLAPNAVAAKVGMDAHLPRIGEYCQKAAEIAGALHGLEGITVRPENPPTNMMHLLFKGDKDKLEEAFWEVARDTGMLICSRLFPTEEPDVWKMEVNVSNTTMSLDPRVLRESMARVLASPLGAKLG